MCRLRYWCPRGGDRYKNGFLGFNPAKAEYMLQAFSPGALTTAYKLASTGVRAYRGEEIARTPIPFLDKFSAYVPQGYDMAAYRRVAEKVETEYKRLTDPNTSESVKQQIREDYPQLGRMHAVYGATYQQLRKLNSTLNTIENSPNIPDEEKIQRKNEIKKLAKEAYGRFFSRAIESGLKEQAIGD